jgi:predicted nucleotidyltransferase
MESDFQIEVLPEGLSDFCQRWKISELALFGSVLRRDFRPDSDVDVLATFEEGARWSLFDLVRMQNELENLFGRQVDLVERNAIEKSENYIRRKNILSNLEVIYAAG